MSESDNCCDVRENECCKEEKYEYNLNMVQFFVSFFTPGSRELVIIFEIDFFNSLSEESKGITLP